MFSQVFSSVAGVFGAPLYSTVSKAYRRMHVGHPMTNREVSVGGNVKLKKKQPYSKETICDSTIHPTNNDNSGIRFDFVHELKRVHDNTAPVQFYYVSAILSTM